MHQIPVGWPQQASCKKLTTNSTAKNTVVPGASGQRIIVKGIRANAAAALYFDVIQNLEGVETIIYNDVFVNAGTPGFRWEDDDGLFELAPGASLVIKSEGTALTHYNVTYWQHP
jgi:hypothetical protein